jgi:hypothetical protein
MIAAELKRGIRNIELAVISNLRERGGSITGKSFVWNHGIDNDTPRQIICAHITANARIACLILPRECCEDSASTVNRKEVREAIEECVAFLATRPE